MAIASAGPAPASAMIRSLRQHALGGELADITDIGLVGRARRIGAGAVDGDDADVLAQRIDDLRHCSADRYDPFRIRRDLLGAGRCAGKRQENKGRGEGSCGGARGSEKLHAGKFLLPKGKRYRHAERRKPNDRGAPLPATFNLT
jgi:hypothetical protein